MSPFKGEEKLEYNRKYWKENKDKINAIRRQKFQENIDDIKKKSYAKGKLRDSIVWNKLEKQDICRECGSKRFVEAHHPDYNRPLEIVWLCKSCHKLEHNKTS